jgi:hypothetical protein
LTDANETRIPLGEIRTYPGAASIGVSVSTVVACFEYYNKTPIEKNSVSKDNHYLVWGGASSLGQIAIQIGKYIGFTVVTTASEKNHALMKDLGADAVFDYHDADVVDKIKAFSGDKLVVAYDTISEGGTTDQVFAAMAPNTRTKVNTSLAVANIAELQEKYPNIMTDFPLAYLTADEKKQFGVNSPEIPSPPGLHEAAIRGTARINTILQKEPNVIRHMPVRVLPGGIEGIIAGLEVLRSGAYSAEKVALSF